MAVAEAAVSIAPAADEKPEGIQWFSMRPKRTQAMPQHTLFGTNMESFDKNSLRDTEARYIPEGYIRPTPNRYPLPDYLQHKLTGREALESSRRDLLRQKNVFSEIDKELRAKAQGALSFKESKQHPSQTARSDRSKRPTWLTEEDLKHSEDINIVGLNARGSYNRDKYGPKPRRHNYSLIGDVMAKNMEFNTPRVGIQDNEEAFRRGKACGWGPGRQLPYELMDDKTKKSKSKSRSLVDLPPNIRHTFGSRVCDSLLSDKELVDRAMERQKVSSGPPRPSKKENVEGLPVDLKGNYESLGQAMRYNVFPGLTTEHTISRTQDDFNDEVHLRRVPNPDEYRYQRDELSIWVEQDVLRKRREQKWVTYFESLPKFSVSWDRNASRPIVQVTKPAPKPKPKPKSRPKPKAEPEPEPEEEIVFVTPPLTPPPQQPEIVELPKQFERDDEFWNFFDQTLPR